MKKELKDIEFMLSLNTDTRELILKFYDKLNDVNNKQSWIDSFKDIQQSLINNSESYELENSDNTPHKKCFRIFQKTIMTESNAMELREKFLQFKKEFEYTS